MNPKKFCKCFFSFLCFCLIIIGMLTVIVDPLFHYHGPLTNLAYQFRSGERYVNDGITKHWEYDAIITGTSMCENFKTSEFDALFDVVSIKVTFSGGRYKEVNDNLKVAFEKSANDIRIVVRGLDTQLLNVDKDEKREDAVYPYYLTNANPFDDVHYLFNKEIFLWETIQTCILTGSGYERKSFDSYANWMANATFGKEFILSNYSRIITIPSNEGLSDMEKQRIRENIEQNILNVVDNNPQCKFYFFFPPYNILWYDYELRNGEFLKNYEAEKLAIEMLLPYENVYLFSWNDRFELTTDLDKYRDLTHYHQDINSQILVWMKDGDGLLNMDNYMDYLARCYKFYSTYDYDSIFVD